MNQKDFVYFDSSQQYISNKRQRIPKGNKKNGQPRETENIGYTRRRKKKQKKTQYVLDTTIHKQTQTT